MAAPLQIDNDDILYRRLVSFHIDPDGSVNSAAYKTRGKPDKSISVQLARLWQNPNDAIACGGMPGLGLGELKTRVPRGLSLEVRHAPTSGDPSHTLCEGENSKPKCRLLAEETFVLIPPAKPLNLDAI